MAKHYVVACANADNFREACGRRRVANEVNDLGMCWVVARIRQNLAQRILPMSPPLHLDNFSLTQQVDATDRRLNFNAAIREVDCQHISHRAFRSSAVVDVETIALRDASRGKVVAVFVSDLVVELRPRQALEMRDD